MSYKNFSMKLEVNCEKLAKGIADAIKFDLKEAPENPGQSMQVVHHILDSVIKVLEGFKGDGESCAKLSKILNVPSNYTEASCGEMTEELLNGSDFSNEDKERIAQLIKRLIS